MSDGDLFNMESIHDEHWRNMPEFVQNRQEPYAKIIVRVDSESDLQELSKRLEQPLTDKTKSAWFPFRSHWRGRAQPVWKSES